ncbi:MAG: PIN domain-containing protein [Nitrospira sp.]|nr:PIN domain-containing protein [Nitrospira sp.]
MKLHLDTNIFLEILLAQDQAEESQILLKNTHHHELFLTDYSLHSIGLLLFRKGQHQTFELFLRDLAGLSLLSLSIDDTAEVATAATQFHLDFDDAYQYVTAKKHHLTIVSFDHDFDKTDRGRKTPREILSDSIL